MVRRVCAPRPRRRRAAAPRPPPAAGHARERSAHRRAVHTSEHARGENSEQERHVLSLSATASMRAVFVKCSPPRWTSKRSSHAPAW